MNAMVAAAGTLIALAFADWFLGIGRAIAKGGWSAFDWQQLPAQLKNIFVPYVLPNLGLAIVQATQGGGNFNADALTAAVVLGCGAASAKLIADMVAKLTGDTPMLSDSWR